MKGWEKNLVGKWFAILLVLCFFSCTGSQNRASYTPPGKTLRFDDHIYEERIRSVQFYEASGNSEEILEYPIVSLGQDSPLYLKFDDLSENFSEYYVKIIHCNRDWTRSMLAEMEYIGDFNEARITQYESSSGTRVPFTHYEFIVPKVLMSGNYLLMVYRNANPKDIVLTRRFVVFDSKVVVNMEVQFTNSVELRWENQQVMFTIDYGRMPSLDNPPQTVSVVVRKNGRWDNAIYDLETLYFRPSERMLDYRHFDLQNNFKGGNEYRWFDIRSLYQRGMGIARIINENNNPIAVLELDTSRTDKVYVYRPDINGFFSIQQYETNEGDLTSDYIQTIFSLKSPPLPGQVYVFGQLSDWKFSKDWRMHYVDSLGVYQLKQTLKQGYYNYKYFYRPSPDAEPSEVRFEGSFNLTENVYDIIVYYRPVSGIYDQVIAYQRMNFYGREEER